MNIPENEIPSFSVLRPNQALSEGVPSGQADSREHKNVIAQRAIQICLRVHFTARWKVNMLNYGFGAHAAIVLFDCYRDPSA